MTEGGDGAIDQPRIDLQQILIAQAQSREGAGAEIFHQHISAGNQLAENLARFCLLQIKRHAALVRPLRQVIAAHARAIEIPIAATDAALVWVLRVFDLDHIRAEQAQLIGREGAGQNMGRVYDANAFEGTGHG